jgi:hypothetical protein
VNDMEDLQAAERAMNEDSVLASIRAADVAAGGRQCRVCGCTQNAGCDPPCYWIAPDLCSTCRDHQTLLEAAQEEFRATQQAKVFLGYPVRDTL